MIVSPPCRVLVFQEMLYRCVLCRTSVRCVSGKLIFMLSRRLLSAGSTHYYISQILHAFNLEF